VEHARKTTFLAVQILHRKTLFATREKMDQLLVQSLAFNLKQKEMQLHGSQPNNHVIMKLGHKLHSMTTNKSLSFLKTQMRFQLQRQNLNTNHA